MAYHNYLSHTTEAAFEFPSLGNKGTDQAMQMIVRSKADIPVVEAFITAVKCPGQRTSSKIKVHLIDIEVTTMTTEKSNPEYDAFLRKVERMEQDSSAPPGENNGTEKTHPAPPANPIRDQINRRKIDSLMNQEPANQTISTNNIVRKFTVEYKGESTKTMDNVFLRADDKVKFVGALTRFKEDKQLMEELGVPNKLNIMLCGPPGTGKSTCVVAAATYLGKDIYYVNGASIQSNRDLQEVYDYIPKNCPQGGILVFEDVDAACPVLLKRNHAKTSSLLPALNSSTGNNKEKDTEPLTLDYWLNLAQGIVTPDGLVTIFTTNHIDDLDPAFRRDGRIDCTVTLGNCDTTQVAAIYRRFIQSPIPPATLDRIQADAFAPVNIIQQCIKYVHNRDTDPNEIMAPFMATAGGLHGTGIIGRIERGASEDDTQY